jgi:hypothetical protein
MVDSQIVGKTPLTGLLTLLIYTMSFDELSSLQSQIEHFLRLLPAIMSGLGIFVEEPEAGDRTTAKPLFHRIFTSDLSSCIGFRRGCSQL